MIRYQDNVFLINGQKEFIAGAEMHYWRIRPEDWNDRLIKIKDAGFNTVSTYVNWAFHEAKEGEVDLTGKTDPRKDLATFLNLAEKHGLYVQLRIGPYIMSEVQDHGLPRWLFKHYPEVVGKRKDGSDHVIVSYLHEMYLKLVDRWYRHVFEIVAPHQITNGGKVIMIQLDNEVGMFTWIHNHPDYSDAVLRRFARYLQNKYSLNEFQQHFQTSEVDIEAFVFNHLKMPPREIAIPLMNEWMLFHREYYRDYLLTLKRIGEKYGLNVPVIVNIHGFSSIDYAKRGLQYPIGLSQLLRTNEIENVVLAGDYYVGNIVPDNFHDILLANAFTKSIQPKGQPLYSAEFQSGFQIEIPRLQPTTLDIKSRLCIGDGMNAINYYMFVGGENPDHLGIFGRRHDWQAPIGMHGEMRPHFNVAKRLIQTIRAYGDALLEAKPKVALHLGFDPSLYMTEYDIPETRHFKQELQRLREVLLYNGLGKALGFLNITFEAVNLLDETPISVAHVPYLWVFSTGYMAKETQEKLLRYVEEGGTLILSPLLPTKDFDHRECRVLVDALNIAIKGREDWKFITFEDLDNIGTVVTQYYDEEKGFASLEDDPKKVVGFLKKHGKGKVVIFGAGILTEHVHKAYAYGKVLDVLHIKPLVETDQWLYTQVRQGPKGTFLFIHNLDEVHKSSRMQLDQELLFDGIPLIIPPRKSVILPIKWQAADDVLVIYSTAEVIHMKTTDERVELAIDAFDKGVIKIETTGQVWVDHGTAIQLTETTYLVTTYQPTACVTIYR